jgi:hypothetical protein
MYLEFASDESEQGPTLEIDPRNSRTGRLAADPRMTTLVGI